MKLFGGNGKKGRFSFYDRLSFKSRLVIGIVMVAAAVVMTAAALALRSIKPPEPFDSSALAGNPGNESDIIREVGEIEIFDASRKDDFFTILVAGTDYFGGNTDTLMLAAFDITAKKVNVMSIPRDTMVNVKRAVKKINAAYTVGGKSGNIEELLSEVESVVGFKPDRYAVVSLQGFIDLIDEIGGITVDVPIDMKYSDPTQNLTINIKKGVQTLNGYDAMGFMRYRHTYVDGDIGRIKAQHAFIEAFMKKMISPSTLSKLPGLAEIAMENVKTDLDIGNLIWLGKECLSLDTENDVKLFTLPGVGKYVNGGSYYIINEESALEIINEYFNPYVTPIRSLNLPG
ncbi:MAG: LCP family protein [Clostridiales bacterium]|nr:LCP family protein [Clostridiales bacterium]